MVQDHLVDEGAVEQVSDDVGLRSLQQLVGRVILQCLGDAVAGTAQVLAELAAAEQEVRVHRTIVLHGSDRTARMLSDTFRVTE